MKYLLPITLLLSAVTSVYASSFDNGYPAGQPVTKSHHGSTSNLTRATEEDSQETSTDETSPLPDSCLDSKPRDKQQEQPHPTTGELTPVATRTLSLVLQQQPPEITAATQRDDFQAPRRKTPVLEERTQEGLIITTRTIAATDDTSSTNLAPIFQKLNFSPAQAQVLIAAIALARAKGELLQKEAAFHQAQATVEASTVDTTATALTRGKRKAVRKTRTRLVGATLLDGAQATKGTILPLTIIEQLAELCATLIQTNHVSPTLTAAELLALKTSASTVLGAAQRRRARIATSTEETTTERDTQEINESDLTTALQKLAHDTDADGIAGISALLQQVNVSSDDLVTIHESLTSVADTTQVKPKGCLSFKGKGKRSKASKDKNALIRDQHLESLERILKAAQSTQDTTVSVM